MMVLNASLLLLHLPSCLIPHSCFPLPPTPPCSPSFSPFPASSFPSCSCSCSWSCSRSCSCSCSCPCLCSCSCSCCCCCSCSAAAPAPAPAHRLLSSRRNSSQSDQTGNSFLLLDRTCRKHVQNVLSKYAFKLCFQIVLSKYAFKICFQNVLSKCAFKMCFQNVIPHRDSVGIPEGFRGIPYGFAGIPWDSAWSKL